MFLQPTRKQSQWKCLNGEMRVQAMQNQVFIAMCNRIGKEDSMDFSGESLVIHPNGDVLAKADDSEQLLTCEINLQEASQLRNKIPYLKTRRPELLFIRRDLIINHVEMPLSL